MGFGSSEFSLDCGHRIRWSRARCHWGGCVGSVCHYHHSPFCPSPPPIFNIIYTHSVQHIFFPIIHASITLAYRAQTHLPCSTGCMFLITSTHRRVWYTLTLFLWFIFAKLVTIIIVCEFYQVIHNHYEDLVPDQLRNYRQEGIGFNSS